MDKTNQDEGLDGLIMPILGVKEEMEIVEMRHVGLNLLTELSDLDLSDDNPVVDMSSILEDVIANIMLFCKAHRYNFWAAIDQGVWLADRSKNMQTGKLIVDEIRAGSHRAFPYIDRKEEDSTT